MWGIRGSAAVLAVVLLAACGAGGDADAGAADPPVPSPAGGSAGAAGGAQWRLVEMPGVVRAVDTATELTAAAEQEGKPVVAAVHRGAAHPLPMTGGPRDGVRSVSTNGMYVALSERTDVAAGDPATFWFGFVLHADAGIDPEWTRETVEDRAGRPARWLRPLLDGEENFRAVGAVRTGGVWTLHAWALEDSWLPIDRDDRLRTRTDPAGLHAATTEAVVVVAGEVSGTGGTGGGPQVWWLADTLIDDPSGTARWRRAPTATQPDAITDLESWDLGWWVAGHRGLRPVVYDFDDAPGAELPAPDTRLDPERPTVLVAGVPVTGPMVLATQSATGVEVWTDAGGGRWDRVPGPRGVLEDAVLVPDDGLYLVVDGTLWYRADAGAGAGPAGTPSP